MATDKAIVTNITALRAKYGAGYTQVKQALDQLVAADKARGLATKLVAIDSATDMRRAKGKPVASVKNQPQAKAAIDAIFKAYAPNYVMIVGASDVVPHITLDNPVGDDDPNVPSDVPYACTAPYSKNPKNFLGPTRVVGRLPDHVGATSPAFLVKLLGIAAGHRSRDRTHYSQHLAMSAEVWKKSTQLSLANLFGQAATVHTSPPSGPSWTPTQLRTRVHFINCHGAPSDPTFYGQRGRVYPEAHQAKKLKGRIADGAVIAAECCYGGELYDPSDANGQAGICSTYLAEGAYAFLGSSTIAYGPAEGNGQADLICQYFIEAVLKGASTGRATLEARQRFAAQFSHLDPSDLKTLVQFNLLGDPAIHPVQSASHTFARSKTFQRALKQGAIQPGARAFRRERLARTGSNLSQTLGAVQPIPLRTPAVVQKVLRQAARESGLRRTQINTYRIAFPGGATPQGLPQVAAARRDRSIHMLTGRRKDAPAQGAIGRSAIIATVQGGRIVHVRRVHSR
jgi:hypothetical protein